MLITERPEPRTPGRRRGGWKAALAPPLPYRGGFECAAILDEVPGALGQLAFQRARDVLLWISTPPQHRSGLFHSADPLAVPAESGDAAPAFRILGRMVELPLDTSVTRVAGACAAISEWAEAQSYPETAVWYAEIAAIAEPRNAQRAWAVGRALRQAAHYDRSRQWLERAVGLARREGNRSLQGASYLSLGNLDFHLGNQPVARRWWTKAWRISRKFNLDHAGPSRHNLMTLCMLQGKFGEAGEHAAAAFELYDRSAAGFPGFVHDAGQLWSWQAFFPLAVSVFQAVLPILPPKEQFIAASNLARAAAGAGDRERFLAAWGEAEARLSPRNEFAAEGLASVAEGAQFLGFSARAVELARRAEELAHARREPDTVELARRIQARVRSCEPPPRPMDPPDEVRALANRILRALAA